jgi:hypothetical protein
MATNNPGSKAGALADAESGLVEPFEQISTPGCYILKQTGTLLRVPADALVRERSPAINVVSKDQWLVAKISSDPYMVLSKARAIAADFDLPVNF